MDKLAYFFQNDTLLLPIEISDSEIDAALPLELSKELNESIEPDIFEISLLDMPPIMVVSVAPEIALPENWKSIPVRQLLAMHSRKAECKSNVDKILRACHIVQWKKESRFCGTCGAENDYISVQAHRLCPRCGRQEFPRICPAMIVVITDDENRILLAYNKRFKTRVYSHISGFNEAGETLEETVVREVREEINIEVKDIEYIKSQPWPFPNSLMLGFKARYLSGTIRCDGEEIEDAKWFTKDNLPEISGEGSLSRYLINCWLDNSL